MMTIALYAEGDKLYNKFSQGSSHQVRSYTGSKTMGNPGFTLVAFPPFGLGSGSVPFLRPVICAQTKYWMVT